ncbi:FkbM family methyltransferase [Pedobacter sp. Leaf170]|uniref:FkbM family methyltransferase n=1 Tax=Pedobacter sp. Leaf170 TaxID=2876558 RepID=UPI001E4E7D0F|nr:FkbM family methyltransferase [Pedobacter sp. Leaf170]
MKKDLQPINFLDDTYFFAKKGLTGITGNIYTGLHEFNEMGFLLHFLRPEDTFFDVGANVGSYTLLASGVCKSRTVAFEPVPQTFEILKQNIILNKLYNLVKLINKGVGNETGKLDFVANEDTTNHVASAKDLDKISVEVIKLDDYASLNPIFIKIDVEGYETEVLNGAIDVLKNSNLKAIVIELNGSGERYGYKEEFIHKKLISNSFSPYSYNPFSRILNKLETFGTFNTIYIRDIDFVYGRLKSGKSFSLFNETI